MKKAINKVADMIGRIFTQPLKMTLDVFIFLFLRLIAFAVIVACTIPLASALLGPDGMAGWVARTLGAICLRTGQCDLTITYPALGVALVFANCLLAAIGLILHGLDIEDEDMDEEIEDEQEEDYQGEKVTA